MGGSSRRLNANVTDERLFKAAGMSQADQDFLNQERNAQLKAERLLQSLKKSEVKKEKGIILG